LDIEIREVIEVRDLSDLVTRFNSILTLGEEYELIDNDFSLIELCSIVFIDDTSLEMTLYIYEFALGEELLRSFCEWSPCNTIGILSIRE
jgi:hypothetical protein